MGGREEILNVLRGGADCGIPGFTWSSDTCSFYRRHRKLINSLVLETAEELGEGVIRFVMNFKCLDATQEEAGRCLFSGKLGEDTTQIENALTWFALESVCQLFDE